MTTTSKLVSTIQFFNQLALLNLWSRSILLKCVAVTVHKTYLVLISSDKFYTTYISSR